MPPLIAHVIYNLSVGGLENGLVNIINHMPETRYRHAIICLKGYSDFSQRIRCADVELIALHKREGKDPGLYYRLWRALRRLQPALVHTRNLTALEGQAIALLAGVRARVHSEHGREGVDLAGNHAKYNALRKAIRPCVSHYITVSAELRDWLMATIHVPADRVTQICNGVDSERFHPREADRIPVGPPGFAPAGSFVIGAVGRMAEVKGHLHLVRAFILLLAREPALRQQARLVIIGDGPQRAACLEALTRAGVEHLAWLPGERSDVAELLRQFDLFALPSLGEGISNTILEAMACGLPVLATAVGGNAELVQHGHTGTLVPAADPDALAQGMLAYLHDTALVARDGAAARAAVEAQYSLDAMVRGYLSVYDRVLHNTVSSST